MTAIASQNNIPNHFPDPQDMVSVTNILVYSDTGSAKGYGAPKGKIIRNTDFVI